MVICELVFDVRTTCQHPPDLTALISQIDADRRSGTTPDHAVRSFYVSNFRFYESLALRISMALMATITVEALIKTAPTAGVSRIPAP